jgi:hypothetical protein
MDDRRHSFRRNRTLRLFGLLAVALAAIAPAIRAQQFTQITVTAPPPPGVNQTNAVITGNPGGIVYFYWVLAQYPGGASLPLAPAVVNNAPAALSASNYVTISWTPPAAGLTYDVLRTAGPTLPITGSCSCAVGTGLSTNSVQDQGSSLSSYTVQAKPPATGTIVLDNSGSSPQWRFSPTVGAAAGVNAFSGRQGNVSPAPGDYNASQITNAVDKTAANTYSGGGLQDLSAMKLKPPTSTVASLPAAGGATSQVYEVTDGASSSDCSAGSGSTRVWCVSDGASWVAMGGTGGGGGSPGGSSGSFQKNNSGAFGGANISENADGSDNAAKAFTWAAAYKPTFNAGGTTTCDWSQSNLCEVDFGAGNTTLAFSNPHGSGPYMLRSCQDVTGGRLYTFSGTMKGFQQPDAAAGVTNCTEQPASFDGTNYQAGPATVPTSAWHGLSCPEGTVPTGVAAYDILYCDSVSHRLKVILNNGSAAQLVISGVDVSTSDQVTATHLAAPLPRAQGGTANTAGAIAQQFFGTAAPGSVAGNLPGDRYSDTTNHHDYWCGAASGTAAPACTSVTTGGWTQADAAGGGGASGQTMSSGGSISLPTTTGVAARDLARSLNGTFSADLYTPASGHAAIVDGCTFHNDGANTASFLIQIKISATYFRITAGASIATGSNPTTQSVGFVLDSTMTLSVFESSGAATTTSVVCSVRDWTIPGSGPVVKSTLVSTLAAGDNTIYTCPAATTCVPLTTTNTVGIIQPGNSVMSITNNTGGTRTYRWKLTPSGGAATNLSPSFTVSDTTSSTKNGLGSLVAGDAMVLNTDANTAGQVVWLTTAELK